MAFCSFLKFGIIAFLVRDRARILYVQHHRARSDGWQSTALCDPCARMRRDDWYLWYNCARTPPCRCVSCVRQPPSLKTSAAHVVFHIVLSPERFRVSRVTTFDHYVYAFHSERVQFPQLLPRFGVFRQLSHPIDSAGRRYHLHHAPSESTFVASYYLTFYLASDAVCSLRALFSGGCPLSFRSSKTTKKRLKNKKRYFSTGTILACMSKKTNISLSCA